MPVAKNAPFEASSVPCTCEGFCDKPDGSPSDHCLCARAGGAERVLRFVMETDGRLAPAQREWCLAEIDSIEGFRRQDYEASTDAEIASATIDAWIDYCRDKGML